MRESKCRGIPSKPVLLTGHGTLPAQKADRRESPSGDSADKTTGETCPGKSSNGKEKRPRSRRKKVSVPGFCHTSPEKEISSPEKRIPGLGISCSGPEISRQRPQKVNDTDKNLHKSPVLCKKIAQKSAIWAGLRKSRVTKISQNGTLCLFLQAFHDILFLSPPADTLRRICNSAQMEGRISESANPQGLAENIYERHIFNRYIFADYKSLYLVTWDCKFHAAGYFGCTYDREILRQDTFWGRWNGVAVDVFLSRKTFCKTVSFVVLPC